MSTLMSDVLEPCPETLEQTDKPYKKCNAENFSNKKPRE